MNTATLELFDKSLIILLSYQALIFAVILLLFKKQNNRSKRILGFYMVLNALYYSFSFCFYNGNYNTFTKLYYLIIPIISLFQPYFYFYIKSLTDPYFKCSKKQFVHFILPSIFLLINIIFFSQLTNQQYIDLFNLKDTHSNNVYELFYFLHTSGYHLILSLQAIVYFGLIIKLVYNHKKNLPENFANYEGVNLNWLITLFVIFLSITILQEVYGNIKDITTNITSRISYNVFMLFTLAFIGISGIKQKEIYSNLFNLFNNEKPSCDENISDNEKKYKSSSLSDNEKQKLAKELKDLLEVEKIFMDNQLKLDNIVDRLNTNRQYLSQIINEVYKQNFYSLINKYRIEEAKKMFFNKKHQQMTIMGIANTVGFNSKSTFNTLFKKFTGKTPTQFIKEQNL